MNNFKYNLYSKPSILSLLCSTNIKVLIGLTREATVNKGPIHFFSNFLDSFQGEDAAHFYNYWINLYHIAQNKKDSDEKRQCFAFLLSFLLIQFPQEKVHFYHLLIIAL